MIFTRETMASRNLSGGVITGCSTPSMRNRIRISFSYGSMWMSLAPALNGREQQGVDEPDDRRFAALPLERRGVDFLRVGDDLETIGLRPELFERPAHQVGRRGRR